MAQPLMPKATAVWLVENTALTFEQIAAFCGLHALEVKAIADGEVAVGMVGVDPVANGQLTQAEIDRCSANPATRLQRQLQHRPHVSDVPLVCGRYRRNGSAEQRVHDLHTGRQYHGHAVGCRV